MITALDSSILIDVLIDDPKHGAASEAALGQARREGALIICETVLAEVLPVLKEGEVEAFLSDWRACQMLCDPAAHPRSRLLQGLFQGFSHLEPVISAAI